MIYQLLDPAKPVRQGDIFRLLPIAEAIPLQDVTILQGTEARPGVSSSADAIVRNMTWFDASQRFGQWPQQIVVTVSRSYGIVMTQDCDCAFNPHIAVCRVTRFSDVFPESLPQEWGPEKRAKTLIELYKTSPRWFYLPPDKGIGFTEKMAADFKSVTHVSSSGLADLRGALRVGRLNDVAASHFRERVCDFYSRYAFNEWYCLDAEEYRAYRAWREKKGTQPASIEPYEWQNTPPTGSDG